jgi:6-phosphogluconolactonase (cycloisomerase 2 family)
MQTVKEIRRWGVRLLLAMSLIVPLLSAGAGSAAAEEDGPRAVYTLTNSASGNEVVVFHRAADGTLTPAGSYATGGLGTGSGLGSQGALVLSDDGQWLFAVNAGSNEISVFQVRPNGLVLTDKVSSGGDLPISLTVHDRVLYVVNAGGAGNITGFRVGHGGKLSPLAGSTQFLSNHGVGAAPGPAQVAFSPDGDVLVVTEKTTNLIDTYRVDDGLAHGPMTHASSGATPFGFNFGKRGTLIVSEAAGGAAGASTVSSYHVAENHFAVVSPSVPDDQSAACWLVVNGNGKYAYTANAGSGSISSYSVGRDGSLTLLNSQAAFIGNGSHPIDMALSTNSHYLYALASNAQTINAFQVQADGSLTPIGSVGGLPASMSGLAAR